MFYILGEKFDQIAQAYRILIDPSLRSEVDQKMKVTLARKEEDRKRTDEQKKMKDDLSRKEAEGIMIYFFEIYLAFQQKKSYFTPKEIQQLKIQRIREANARIAASLFEEKKVNKKTTESMLFLVIYTLFIDVAKTDEKEIYMSDDEFLAYEKKILDNLKNHINNN